MIESQATSGSDSPRHAEFRFLPLHKSRFGFSTRFLCSRGYVAFVSRAVMVLLVWFLASLMSCFLDRVVGRRSSLPGGPFSFLFLRGWNRHRRKGVRGSGSQAASRRGAKPRRIAFAFKVPSDTLFGWGTRWLMGFIPFLITLPNQAETQVVASHLHGVSHHIRTGFCLGGGSVECNLSFLPALPFSASLPWPWPCSGPGLATFPPLTRFPRTVRVLVGGADILPANLALARPLPVRGEKVRPRALPGSTRGCR